MKKIVRLTESDLTRIVSRVLKESVDDEKLNKIHDYLIIGDKKKLNNNIILINEPKKKSLKPAA